MGDHIPPVLEPPKGYVSEEARRRYTITTGILGAAFFFAQMFLPFVIMLLCMPAFFITKAFQFKFADTQSGAFWNEQLWYVEKQEGFTDQAGKASALMRLGDPDWNKPVMVDALDMVRPSLLPGDDRLWIISSGSVAYYKDGRTALIDPGEKLGDISRPFMYRGSPAVMEERPAGQALRILEGEQWETEASFDLTGKEDSSPVMGCLRVAACDQEIHFFLRFGDTVYHHEGIPRAEEDSISSWEPVLSSERIGGNWSAVCDGAGPAVFYTGRSPFNPVISGLKYDGKSWAEFFSFGAGTSRRHGRLISEFGVYPAGGQGDFMVLSQSFPGSLHLMKIRGGSVKEQVRYGSGFPFPSGFMSMMLIPHVFTILLPLILAFILSAQMRKHRLCEHAVGDASMQFAPLWKRATAQIIDGVFFGGPMLAGYIIMFSDFERMMDPMFMVICFSLFAGGMVWAVCLLLVFSFLEGRWGRTPGKWITGIQVLGIDFKPCGFGRAVVRNLLKFVDGFFNFMVGVLLVALSENWQRVGDMAARTVVVDSRGSFGSSTPERQV